MSNMNTNPKNNIPRAPQAPGLPKPKAPAPKIVVGKPPPKPMAPRAPGPKPGFDQQNYGEATKNGRKPGSTLKPPTKKG